MPLLRAGRPLKRWRYVGLYRPDVMACIGDARVAGMPQRWWAVALPDGTLHEWTGAGRGGVDLAPGRARVETDAVSIDLALDEGPGVEVVSPSGRSYIWTSKQAPVRARGLVRVGEREWRVDGDEVFVDESAGYHRRHTVWRWSAGIGRAESGATVAWNLVAGVHDSPRASERTVWVDGGAHEVGDQEFADDLSGVGRPGLHALEHPRGPHPAPAVPQRLPPTVRLLHGRASRWPPAGLGIRRDGVARRSLVGQWSGARPGHRPGLRSSLGSGARPDPAALLPSTRRRGRICSRP